MVNSVSIISLSLFIALFITYLTNNYIKNLIKHEIEKESLKKSIRLKLETIIIFYAISIFLVYWLTELAIIEDIQETLLSLILIIPFAWFIYFLLIHRKKIIQIFTPTKFFRYSKWD